MKTLIVLGIAALALATTLTSCGSDSVTGPNTPPVTTNDSLIFHWDSLSTYCTVGLYSKDSIYTYLPQQTSRDTLKIECDYNTNDSATAGCRIYYVNPAYSLDITYQGSLTSHFSLKFFEDSPTTTFIIYAYSAGAGHYLRLTNIKLWKVKT